MEIGGDSNLDLDVTGAFPIGRNLIAGVDGSFESDRFFADHSWNFWFGGIFRERLIVAVSGDIVGYSFDPGDAQIEDIDDHIISPHNELRPSVSAGFALQIGRDISVAAVGKNLLRPDISIGNDAEDRLPAMLSGGIAMRFGKAVPFADIDIELGDDPIYGFRAGIAMTSMMDRARLTFGGGNESVFGSAGYDFGGGIAVGYGIEKPVGDAANVRGLRHEIYLEFTDLAASRIEPDTLPKGCPSNPLPAKWLRISKPAGAAPYLLSIQAERYDSMLFHISPNRYIIMDWDRENGIWSVELDDFPGPNLWVSAFDGEDGFCIPKIYRDGPSAARMTVIMDEYELLVPMAGASSGMEIISEIRAKGVPFYLDSDDASEWNAYLDSPDADRFLFAAPGFDPEPPQIELSSEFAVEKIDNRMHAVVEVSMTGMPHRIIATSSWTGDCAVNSDTPSDTLTFIVPNRIPGTVPLVVTGSATDPWFRVHIIGPDTLDNVVISKVWDGTDYTLFNFIYYAENDRHCRGDVDPKLARLISRAEESGGKLMITGKYFTDAHCAYNHARKTLPASQVRIDPSLVSDDRLFSGLWKAPDSLWFVNNFSQAIVEWTPTPQPDDVAGYIVFASGSAIPPATNFIEVKGFQINAEPVCGDMFILSGLTPEMDYHIRIAPISGDGRLGELSDQLIVRTKAIRKTSIYEFKSKLGNQSAFDFSEYSEVSMLYKNLSLIDIYLGTNASGDDYGSLMLKSPSRVTSERKIWQTRNAGILFMDVEPFDAPFDVQKFTTMGKAQEEPCRIGARYLVRTPDGYELIIRVESVEGSFPNRRIEIQYLYRLVEDSPVFDLGEK